MPAVPFTSWYSLASLLHTALDEVGFPAYTTAAPVDADAPYRVISLVGTEELQVFDNTTRNSQVTFQVTTFSSRTTGEGAHLVRVDDTIEKLRRESLGAAFQWTANRIIYEGIVNNQVNDELHETVLQFNVLMTATDTA